MAQILVWEGKLSSYGALAKDSDIPHHVLNINVQDLSEGHTPSGLQHGSSRKPYAPAREEEGCPLGPNCQFYRWLIRIQALQLIGTCPCVKDSIRHASLHYETTLLHYHYNYKAGAR